MSRDVLVVIGAGGMGLAIARRVGPGRHIVLADNDETTLRRAGDSLVADGHTVTCQRVDVTSRNSVRELAAAADALGDVTHLAHTAGLSPSQASAPSVLAVDLLGVALVLDAFATVMAAGGAGVVVASMAGHLFPDLPAEQRKALSHTAAEDLLSLPFLSPGELTEPGLAYGIAKQANLLRVSAASSAWGSRGARINSVSPGVISTPMGRLELDSPLGDGMRSMIEASATRRLGTPEDIAAVAAFLLGPESSFVTGTDVLVDGGVTAALLNAG